MLKETILSASTVCLLAFSASAQEKDSPTSGYNHLSLSYDATFSTSSFTIFDDVEGVPGNFTLHGMSLN